MTPSLKDLNQQASGSLNTAKRLLIGQKVLEGDLRLAQAGLNVMDQHGSLELGVDA